ncbi:YcgJ family protein [Aeromonas jandaei]|uniref:YcgJ family protein n=1 Tax=Aeromonas jandaei TaxID=650 RepID=UPI001F3B264D|nr:YcgJ family protein [Aeromonas jandaei]MCF7716536.1 YcgJ family protein [Aeromonas jandaei]
MFKRSAALVALLLIGGVHAAPAVFSPAAKVVCDKKGGYCADSQGISIGLTRAHLGEQAASRLQKNLQGADSGSYTLSNGVHCESSEKQCYKDRYFPRTKESHFTAILFKQGK